MNLMTFITGSDYVGCEHETMIIVDNNNNNKLYNTQSIYMFYSTIFVGSHYTYEITSHARDSNSKEELQWNLH